MINAIAVQYSSNIIVPVGVHRFTGVYRFTVGWCANGRCTESQIMEPDMHCTQYRVVRHGWSKWLYLINGMDNGLEDGMVYGMDYGMEHWESKFTVFDALLLLAL